MGKRRLRDRTNPVIPLVNQLKEVQLHVDHLAQEQERLQGRWAVVSLAARVVLAIQQHKRQVLGPAYHDDEDVGLEQLDHILQVSEDTTDTNGVSANGSGSGSGSGGDGGNASAQAARAEAAAMPPSSTAAHPSGAEPSPQAAPLEPAMSEAAAPPGASETAAGAASACVAPGAPAVATSVPASSALASGGSPPAGSRDASPCSGFSGALEGLPHLAPGADLLNLCRCGSPPAQRRAPRARVSRLRLQPRRP